MTAKRWARRSRGACRPMTARLREKNRGPPAGVRPGARARRCAPARLRTALAVEPRDPHRPPGGPPLVKRLAKDPRLIRQGRHPLARLQPANQRLLLFPRQQARRSHLKAPSYRALSPKSQCLIFGGHSRYSIPNSSRDRRISPDDRNGAHRRIRRPGPSPPPQVSAAPGAGEFSVENLPRRQFTQH
jgi:hypothetical protein